MYYFKPHIDTSFLVTYNALVIAAVIFLLNFHFGELRDVSSWYIEGKPMTNHGFKPFHFWHGNATQPAAVKIVEVKAFFITLLLISIIFLMISSFIIIALIKALYIRARSIYGPKVQIQVKSVFANAAITCGSLSETFSLSS